MGDGNGADVAQTLEELPPFASRSRAERKRCNADFEPAASTADYPEIERFLTVNELAAVWQLHPRTIRRMIADGRVPVRRFGRAVRIQPRRQEKRNRSSKPGSNRQLR